ncbi:hypothetical protein [Pseudoruegeria sp. SK021]|uniref:hypothetical protein n=1 Tax=Pseudoruegeria sp. SK021 TaxID=1933035 RepID=UPI000A25019A|nr:hypothetical protein [Pseudoruegeria sp. SK021]OSP54739.1 hypothetical protein BV911_11285 [Pseudoruegeria sp. SK021]
MTGMGAALTLVAELDLGLDRAWQSLREGRFDRIEQDIAETERLSTELGRFKGQISPTDAERLSWKSRRNQVLLAATAKGLNAAILRIAELRKTLDGTTTYGADGRRVPAETGPGQLSRRA